MIKKLILAAVCLATSIMTNAASYPDFSSLNTDGVRLYYLYVDKAAKTVSLCSNSYYNTDPSSYSGKITIPSTVVYDGVTYTVTTIHSDAFWHASKLTSVVIPSTVTTISKNAFENCTSLTSINLSNVAKIYEKAFKGCSALTSVEIPKSVTMLANEAFSDCTKLVSVTILSNKAINDAPFSETFNLKTIFGPQVTSYRFDGDVTQIKQYSCQGCSNLKSVVMSSKIVSIGTAAFQYCNLSTIAINEGVSTVGLGAFVGNDNLTSVYIYSDKFMNQDFSQYSMYFYFGLNIKEVYFGPQVTSIPAYAFSAGDNYSITQLERVSFGSLYSLKTIGKYAFYNNPKLTRIENFPSSVTTIMDYAFDKCPSLYSITMPKSLNTTGTNGIFNYQNVYEIIADSYHPHFKNQNKVYVFPSSCRVIAATREIADKYIADGFQHVSVEANNMKYEDVNGDGDVNSLDVLKVYKYMQKH